MYVDNWFIHNWTLVENALTKDPYALITKSSHSYLQQQLLGHQLTNFSSLKLSAMVKKGQTLMIMETTWWMELFTLVVIF